VRRRIVARDAVKNAKDAKNAKNANPRRLAFLADLGCRDASEFLETLPNLLNLSELDRFFGLVQKRVFWGNTVGSVREGQGGWRQVCGKSVTVEPAMAQEFEPVLMRPPGEEFRRAAADSFGAIAPREPPVVQEEPQQVQIPIADLPPQEEVAA